MFTGVHHRRLRWPEPPQQCGVLWFLLEPLDRSGTPERGSQLSSCGQLCWQALCHRRRPWRWNLFRQGGNKIDVYWYPHTEPRVITAQLAWRPPILLSTVKTASRWVLFVILLEMEKEVKIFLSFFICDTTMQDKPQEFRHSNQIVLCRRLSLSLSFHYVLSASPFNLLICWVLYYICIYPKGFHFL